MPLLKSKEKKERALGTKLFLKGDRCNSPKCVMVRRPYRPGQHGKKRKPAQSEFGGQLMEKQRIKFSYGLREAQLERIFKNALTKSGSIGETIVSTLERQLSNVLYRGGLVASRIIARQLIGHGHIVVNGKKVTISSFQVRPGDVISIKPNSKNHLIFKDLANNIKKYEPPHWLTLDKEKLEIKIKTLPQEVEMPFDINMVVDYYSK